MVVEWLEGGAILIDMIAVVCCRGDDVVGERRSSSLFDAERAGMW